MNRFNKLLFLIPIIMFGCKSNKINDKMISQTINSLNMNIFSNEGKVLLSIQSPYSSYDKEKNIFNLNETTINLFKDNESEYIVISDSSQLSNNNKLLVLKGNVLVKSSTQEDSKLHANSFTWDIQKSEYLLIGNVKFKNNTITLFSNKAILNKTNNIIEFSNPVKYKINDPMDKKGYEINSENAFYNLETKSVTFKSKEDKVRSKIYF